MNLRLLTALSFAMGQCRNDLSRAIVTAALRMSSDWGIEGTGVLKGRTEQPPLRQSDQDSIFAVVVSSSVLETSEPTWAAKRLEPCGIATI